MPVGCDIHRKRASGYILSKMLQCSNNFLGGAGHLQPMFQLRQRGAMLPLQLLDHGRGLPGR